MELTTYSSYEQYKEHFDSCMKATANNFVTIGHLLIIARDTDILRESGYMTMGAFAKCEYGLDESTASRFIAICEKYGAGSDHLLPEYESHGYAKLSEMLTLPDNVAEIITPEMTREEIREIKQEVREEQAITPIEVALEQRAGNEDEHIETTLIKGYLENRPAEFKKIFEIVSKDVPPEEVHQAIADTLAPSGMGVLVQRLAGIGKFMIKIDGTRNPVTLVDVRNGKNTAIEWGDFTNYIAWIFSPDLFSTPYPEIEDIYKAIYGTDMPEIIETPKQEDRVKTEKKATANATEKLSKTLNKLPQEKQIAPAQEEKKDGEIQSEVDAGGADNIVESGAPAAEENGSLDGGNSETSLQGIESAARNALSNVTAAVNNKAWEAALADAENLVHYIKTILGRA